MAGHLPDPDRDRRHLRGVHKESGLHGDPQRVCRYGRRLLRQPTGYLPCERKKEGNGQICGGEFFCRTAAAPGADRNQQHVRSGRLGARGSGRRWRGCGRAQWCGRPRLYRRSAALQKKMAVGFNNCCKDSGWGGMWACRAAAARKKALGKAKDKS